MGSTTLYAEAEAAGTRLRGSVMISAKGKDISDFGYEIGDAIVENVEAAADEYEPIDDSQPLSGETLEEVIQIVMMALALANTPPRTRDAETMISVCGSGLDREPRFVHAYGYALAMRSQVTARRREQFQAALASVLPRPITPTGKEARVMRVDVDDLDVHYRKDGSGLAEIALTAKHTPMTGKQAKKQAGEAVIFPLPLFDEKQLGTRVETQFSLHGMLVAVVIETAKPAYGLRRELLLAVEEAVEYYKLVDAA